MERENSQKLKAAKSSMKKLAVSSGLLGLSFEEVNRCLMDRELPRYSNLHGDDKKSLMAGFKVVNERVVDRATYNRLQQQAVKNSRISQPPKQPTKPASATFHHVTAEGEIEQLTIDSDGKFTAIFKVLTIPLAVLLALFFVSLVFHYFG